ncbi:MAG TPA: hypothetical protein VF645_11405 [Allosphingosinicella sp.]
MKRGDRRNLLGLAIAGSLTACAAEEPPGVSAEKIEAAADHAQLEVERAAAAAPRRASEASR